MSQLIQHLVQVGNIDFVVRELGKYIGRVICANIVYCLVILEPRSILLEGVTALKSKLRQERGRVLSRPC